jgi:protein-S-isoprenylcysteine O-methyltransferase Ste14
VSSNNVGPFRPRLPDLGPRGEGWVALQLVVFAVIAAAGFLGPAWDGAPRLALSILGIGLILAGASLCARGIFDIRAHITPFPRPGAAAQLMEHGAFGLVRHPIYGGGVIAAFGWGLATASPAAIAAALGAAVFFDLKSRREEDWLRERFEGYDAYRSRTRKLIPWLY